ncbi:DUF2334 domain-containing protein [Paenibacillus lautus]|uniref:DUF2334 domain-containing protein n=1 Tax=Paenibacillus lautus TaxID=1401 RepID=UPI003D2A3441
MWRELEKYIEMLYRMQKPIKIWFRDDDLGFYIPEVKKMVNLFDKVEVPIVYSAIPSLLVNETIDIVRSSKTAFVAQHGWNHRNNSLKAGVKTEFDDDACELSIMINNINQGKKKLQDLFGPKYLNVFVPPWHEMSPKLEQEIYKCRFHYISSWGPNGRNDNNFYEINTQVDIIDWSISDKFAGENYALSQLVSELQEGLTKENSRLCIGILSHHRTMGTEGFEFVERLINTIKILPGVEIIIPKGEVDGKSIIYDS